MMNARILLAFLSLLALPNAAIAQSDAADIAAQSTETGLKISNAYAFATASVQRSGAVFLTITNGLDHDERLISAASEAAKMVQLHSMAQENGIMAMREAVNGFEIKTGETLTLQPTGNHIMLMGLNEPLQEGGTFPVTLTFEKSAPVTLQVEVIAAGSTARIGQE